MLKVKFHQAGVVCPAETSCNMSGYCSVKSTALRFNSTLSLVFTLSVLSIAQATASRSLPASSLFSDRSSSSKLVLCSRPAVVLVATAVSSLGGAAEGSGIEARSGKINAVKYLESLFCSSSSKFLDHSQHLSPSDVRTDAMQYSL